MAKFETIFCALTWGMMNALLAAVIFGSAAPIDRAEPAPITALASIAPPPTA